MIAVKACTQPAAVLKNEIMLQINQHLFERGVITKSVYEQAKLKIVEHT